MSEITRGADGTARFTPPPSFAPDIYRLAQQGQVQASQRKIEGFSSRDFSMTPVKDAKGNYNGEWDWQWTIRDVAGLNLTRGEISDTYNRAASSDADTSYFQQATLPLALTEQTTAFGTAGVYFGISGVNVLGRLVIGVLDNSGAILLGETSSADPTLMALSIALGTSADIINQVNEVRVNSGGSVTTCMALSKNSNPIALYTSTGNTPASLGNMHADTAGAYGIVTTPFGNVIKAANSYWYLAHSSAYNAAPTEYNADAVPAGGWALGMKGIGNRPVRVFFVVPESLTATNFASGSSASLSNADRYHIETTNIYGYERQMFDMPGLKHVTQACFFRDGIIGTDGDNITFMGRTERHIVPFSDRPTDSDMVRKVVGFRVKGHDLFWDVEAVDVSSASPHDTRFWVEHYDWDTDMVTQVTPTITRDGTGHQAYRATGAQPVSDQTGYFHGRMGPNTSSTSRMSWRYWRPEAGQSVYATRAGSSAVIATHPFQVVTEADPITITMPETLFPSPITWARKTITGYYFGGALQYGEACSVACSNAPSTEWRTGTLETGVKEASRWHPVKDSNSGFLLPQPVITFWSGNIVYSTPQVWPITLQGKAFTDEHPKGFRDGA